MHYRFWICFLFLPILSFSQVEEEWNAKALFSAIIVSDIDESIEWYSSILNVELKNKTENAKNNIKQANLRNSNLWIELIELPSEMLMENKATKKSYGLGLFKFGIQIENMDSFISSVNLIDPSQEINIVQDPISQTRNLILKDPDGNRIQVFEDKSP